MNVHEHKVYTIRNDKIKNALKSIYEIDRNKNWLEQIKMCKKYGQR